MKILQQVFYRLRRLGEFDFQSEGEKLIDSVHFKEAKRLCLGLEECPETHRDQATEEKTHRRRAENLRNCLMHEMMRLSKTAKTPEDKAHYEVVKAVLHADDELVTLIDLQKMPDAVDKAMKYFNDPMHENTEITNLQFMLDMENDSDDSEPTFKHMSILISHVQNMWRNR